MATRLKLGKEAARREAADPGLQQIDDLERDIVLAKEQTMTWNGVDPAEIARVLADVVTLAKAVCDRLRSEYLERLARTTNP